MWIQNHAVARWALLAGIALGCRFRYELLPLPEIDGSGATATGGAGSPSQPVAGNPAAAGNDVGGSSASGGAAGEPAGGAEISPGGAESSAGTGGLAGAGPVEPDGLVAYWPFDETSGLVAVDAGPYGNDGTLVDFPSPGWTPGRVGGALALTDGPYLSVAPSASIGTIADSDAFSIAAWVRLDSDRPGFHCVLSMQFETSGWETFGLYFNRISGGVVVNSSGGNHECFTLDQLVGTWIHLAGTFDGQVARAYVDGVEACSIAPDLLDIPVSQNPLLIGSNQNGTNPGEFFEGALDEMVLYRRALSPGEIGELMAGTLP